MILHICCMYSVKYSFMLFSPFSKCFEKFLRINNGQLSLSHFAKVESCYQLEKSNTLGKKCKSQTNSVCSKPKYRSAPSAGGKPRWWRLNKYWIKYLFAWHQFFCWQKANFWNFSRRYDACSVFQILHKPTWKVHPPWKLLMYSVLKQFFTWKNFYIISK